MKDYRKPVGVTVWNEKTDEAEDIDFANRQEAYRQLSAICPDCYCAVRKGGSYGIGDECPNCWQNYDFSNELEKFWLD